MHSEAADGFSATIAARRPAGDPVNRAAKLQNHTKAEGVRALATPLARTRAIEQGYEPGRAARVLAGRAVAGIAEPIDLVAIE